jgi:hypothetical protein
VVTVRYPRRGFEVVAVSRILEAWIAIREPTAQGIAVGSRMRAPASRIIRDGASHFARMKGPDIDLRNDRKMLADGSYGGTVDG